MTAVDDAVAPTAGATTICIKCYVFLIVMDDLTFRVMTNAEWEALPNLHKIALTHVRETLRDAAVEEKK